MSYWLHLATRVVMKAPNPPEKSLQWVELSKEEYDRLLPPNKPANTGLQADGGRAVPDYGPIPDDPPTYYEQCPVCHQLAYFNDYCEWCGYGDNE